MCTVLKDNINEVHTQYEYNKMQHLLKSLKLSKEYMETLKDREAKPSDEIVPKLDEVIKVLGMFTFSFGL